MLTVNLIQIYLQQKYGKIYNAFFHNYYFDEHNVILIMYCSIRIFYSIWCRVSTTASSVVRYRWTGFDLTILVSAGVQVKIMHELIIPLVISTTYPTPPIISQTNISVTQSDVHSVNVVYILFFFCAYYTVKIVLQHP